MSQWAIKYRSDNRLDGKREYLVGRFGMGNPSVPSHMAGHTMMVFRTRQDARDYARERYGYIKDRPDLRAEPHGWKAPQIVKVKVTVEELATQDQT
jgi:hypothetical protein